MTSACHCNWPENDIYKGSRGQAYAVPVIPALGRWRQKTHGFEASLACIEKLCLEKKKEKKKKRERKKIMTRREQGSRFYS